MIYDYTGIYIAFVLILLLGVFAGWKCAVAWHSRKPAPPTNFQRDICKTYSRDRRNVVSAMIQASHANGFAEGQLSKP